jgi:ACR3 family arsenite transporter
MAGLVGINSLLQVFFFSLYAWFYLEIVLPAFGYNALAMDISLKEIALTVFIYLGIPFIAAVLTRLIIINLKGEEWLNLKYIALPLICFFGIMFFLMFLLGKWAGANYEDNAALSFTASGNNFELAIAVSIGVFGINSGQAFAGVIGPLVEVPALIVMVRVAYWLKEKWYR